MTTRASLSSAAPTHNVNRPKEPGAVASARERLCATIVDAEGGFETVQGDWHRLAMAEERRSWCTLPAVFRVWHCTLCRDAKAQIIAIYDSQNELCGIMPIMRGRAWRGPSCVPRYDYAPSDRSLTSSKRPRPLPIRQITPMASIPATMLWTGLLSRSAKKPAVYDAAARAMIDLPGWDVIVLPAYEDNEQEHWVTTFRRLGLQPWVNRLNRVVLNVRDLRPFHQIVADQKTKFRQNVRRAQAAAGRFGIEFNIYEGHEGIGRSLGIIQRVAAASWKHEGRAGTEVVIPYHGPQQAFFERLLLDAELGAVPVVFVASVRNDPIAVLLTLHHGDTVTSLLIFRDNRFSTASPGLLLIGQIIDWSVDRGIKHLDLNATHDWLRYLANDRRTVNNVVVFAPTVLGRSFAFISKLAQRRK